MMNEPTREQKLEAALTQLIQLCASVRYRQRRWKQYFGSDNRVQKETAENKLDKVLQQMGVADDTDFNLVKIKFSKELTVEEMEDLSKNLIK